MITTAVCVAFQWTMVLLSKCCKMRAHENTTFNNNVFYCWSQNRASLKDTHDNRSFCLITIYCLCNLISINCAALHAMLFFFVAGTGKTTTLVKYAQQRPHMRFLYLAFNKSVTMQAQRSFPYNVECSTVHSMAFRAVGVRSVYTVFMGLETFTKQSLVLKDE